MPEKCHKEDILLHFCIPDAIDWQHGLSQSPGASFAGGRGLSKQVNCRCHTCCYNYLTKF